MGGNIFEGTRRISKEEFVKLSYDISVFVREHLYLPYSPFPHVTESYRSKDSFGDIDIILNSRFLVPNWDMELVRHHTQYHRNGNVVSFKYDNVQVDLIVVPDRYFNSACHYFSYNDLGAFIGVLSKKLGFKYGWRGAELIVRDDRNEVILDTELTIKIEDVLHLLDLDSKRYFIGFDNMEEVFEFISKSKYFNPGLFKLENRPHESRIRDAKRKSYMDFLAWIDEREFPNAYQYPVLTSYGGYSVREPFYSKVLVPYFPWVPDIIEAKMKERDEEFAYREKFNGNVVMQVTGLSGQELGLFLHRLKTDRSSVFYNMSREEVISSGDELIRELIQFEFNVYSKLKEDNKL